LRPASLTFRGHLWAKFEVAQRRAAADARAQEQGVFTDSDGFFRFEVELRVEAFFPGFALEALSLLLDVPNSSRQFSVEFGQSEP
jgi:hypothetical protein